MWNNDVIYLVEGECKRKFAWLPVRLDAGVKSGSLIWLRHYYSNPHSTGLWRPAYSIEERPALYDCCSPIKFVDLDMYN